MWLQRHAEMPGLRCRTQVGKAYAGPREALRLTGKFVLAQLLHARFGADACAKLAASPFITALQAEVGRF